MGIERKLTSDEESALAAIPVNKFEDYQMLIQLRDELHKGSWEEMRKDLKKRLIGRPYIFKKINTIEEDLDRIDLLEQTELKYHVTYHAYSEDHELKIGFKTDEE